MAATVAAAVAWASTAGAATTLDVVAVTPAADTVSMVVAVNPAPPLSQPGSFQVSSGDTGNLPTQARAVIGPQLSTGVVLDTSADGAAALQGGINGLSNLLLQLPDGTRTIVVGDGGDKPAVLTPLTQGAVAAVSGVTSARAGGTRHTDDALAAALSPLPTGAGQTRLLLLYTGAADAGGEPAAALGRRLADAGVVLAVVATGDDQGYWSAATAATGGVLVSARDGGSLKPFDEVATLLRERFVLTFPRPGPLPADVRVAVTVGTETTEASAVVPADAATRAPAGSAGSSGSPVPWWIAGVLLVVATVAGGVYLARRRAARPAPVSGPVAAEPERREAPGPAPAVRTERAGRAGEAEARADEPAAPLPRRVPANGTSAISGAAEAARSETARSETAVPASRSEAAAPPAATRPPAAGPTAAPPTAAPTTAPPTTAPPTTGPASAAHAGAAGPTAAPPAAGRPAAAGPPAGRPASPAADERAYSRLDQVTAQAAAAVTAGTLDFRHAVARIAMAAPGRVDLLDRVIEAERRMAGVQIGNSAPTETELKLLTAARRVVAGEVALVDPTGVRVEQAAQVLRLTRPDRTTRECRNAKELARHVDLSTLSTDAPAS
ncbi:MAG TPA: hypothetical protein VI357_20095 [Mycobacteriales bacterium]